VVRSSLSIKFDITAAGKEYRFRTNVFFFVYIFPLATKWFMLKITRTLKFYVVMFLRKICNIC